MKSGLNQYFEEVLVSPTSTQTPQSPQIKAKEKLKVTRSNSNKITLSQYFERELLEETSAEQRMQNMILNDQTESMQESYVEGITNEEEEEIDIYTSYASYMSSSDPGSDNLLVTFDYGFQDSLEADLSLNSQQLELLENDEDDDLNKNLFKIPEESSEDLLKVKYAEMYSKSPNIFKVHQVEHLKSNNTSNNNTRASSCVSIVKSLKEYNIDTSGDYGSWAQSESEPENEDNNEKTYRKYRYEDLIKNEVLIYDDDDDGGEVDGIINGNNDRGEVLINFNFDEDLPPRWFSNNLNNNNNLNNEQLYYRSVDYLN